MKLLCREEEALALPTGDSSQYFFFFKEAKF